MDTQKSLGLSRKKYQLYLRYLNGLAIESQEDDGMILMLTIPNKNYFLQHLIGTIVKHNIDLFDYVQLRQHSASIIIVTVQSQGALSNYTLFLVFSAKRTFHDGARSCLSFSSWFPAKNPSFNELTEVVVTKMIKIRK